MEDLEAGILEFKIVEKFLKERKKEFGRKNKKSKKIAKLKKLKQSQ